MTFYSDIADAIVAALDGIGRFASGSTGDDQKISTAESMEIIAEEMITALRYFSGLEVYQNTTTTTVTQTPTAITFDVARENDPSYIFSPPSSTITVAEEGRYIFDYSVAYSGGSGDRQARAALYLNGSQIPGTRSVTSWLAGNQGSSTNRAILSLEANDEIELYTWRDGTSGTVATVVDSTALSITRGSP